MEQLTYDDQTFEKVIYTGKFITGREFQDCVFKLCNFSDSTFSDNKFLDCTFEGCNLALMKLGNTSLQSVTFKDCKILGVNFHECSDFLFSVEFVNCTLDFASFAGKKMLKTNFSKCSLKETSFIQSILTGSQFHECDMGGTVFNRTDLSSVNFVTAYNYTIDPEINTLKKAVFAEQGLAGLLVKYAIKIV
ncbi:pentapeptide repeat-containing protein [Mucilaginibacter terrae]|uniref:pentapeptide repeat-containing protein n=1 Tax=Mucilaginibacter terrae TaxID=1955052 RepID=UPI0036282251